jgi:hypothetical protein
MKYRLFPSIRLLLLTAIALGILGMPPWFATVKVGAVPLRTLGAPALARHPVSVQALPTGLRAAMRQAQLLPADGWSRQAALTAADGATDDEFGLSVALAADGSTALVGADARNHDTGVAYVFTRSGATWTQQAELTAADGASLDFFGYATALSGDGSTALVGAWGKNVDAGAAYVFVRGASGWSLQAELQGAQDDSFGHAVALAADGSTALVSATARNDATGAVYVFVHDPAGWLQQTVLTASDGTVLDGFGDSVALSGDGTTALIGAWHRNNYTGASYVFVHGGTGWSQQADLTAADKTQRDQFGAAVALSRDGGIALIGADARSTFTGAAYVFAYGGAGWSQQAELRASDKAPNDQFGISVALSGDGTAALIGADIKNNDAGAAYVFAHGVTGWSQQAELTAGTAPQFVGHSVAFSADGTIALAGAYGASQQIGAAYVFSSPGMQIAPVSVVTGWNLIDLPITATSPVSASSVLQSVLQSSGGNLAAIYALHDGAWSQPVMLRRGSPPGGTDFTLQPGVGYLLYSDRAGSYLQTGIVPATQPSCTLAPGWNLVGTSLGATSPISASTVLAEVLQSSGENLAAIYALRDNQWSAPLILPGGSPPAGADFALLPGQGYLLYTDTATSYTPGTAPVVTRRYRPGHSGGGTLPGSARMPPPPRVP